MVITKSESGTFALSLMCMVSYATRIMLPPCLTMMGKELHWSNSELAHVISSFGFGYIWLQVVAGIAADKYGGKSIMTASMIGAGSPNVTKDLV